MKLQDWFNLIFLAAIWGASFLFMRVAVPEFGAFPLIFVRVAVAALLLLPVVWLRKRQQALKAHWKTIAVVGIFNSAVPFTLIAYSTLYLTAGFASVLNAATPLSAALIGYFVYRQKLSKIATGGLFVGFLGVIILVWNKVSPAAGQSTLAILAGLTAAFCYGIAANYSKKNLQGVSSLVITAGSLSAASLFLLPWAIWQWPAVLPSLNSWLNVLTLALLCTGLAYLLYFHLLERVGAANATTVTFLIPAFGLMWGVVFLQEVVAIETLVGCVVILLGTAMTNGLLNFRTKRSSAAQD